MRSLKLDSNNIPTNTQAVMMDIDEYIKAKKGIVVTYKIDQAIRLFIGRQVRKIKDYNLQDAIRNQLNWQYNTSFKLN